MGKVQPPSSSSSSSSSPWCRVEWVAVLTWWTSNFIFSGITKGMGIMLPTLQDQLGSHTWAIGWITALVIAVHGFIGPAAAPLGRRFGTGNVIMTCGAMLGVAGIAGSLVTTAFQLAMVFSVLAGIGIGIFNLLARAAVGRFFTKNYATANGIARTGYSVGLFVSAPLVQLSLGAYGWRGTMLLMGGVMLHGAVCGALTLKVGEPNKPPEIDTKYQELPGQDEPVNSHPVKLTARCADLWQKSFKSFDLELIRNGRYWAVAVLYCATMFPIDMWIVYFASLAQSNGFSIEDTGMFVTAAGLGNTVAKVSQGFVTDRGVLSPWAFTTMALAVGIAAMLATPFMTSYWPMMVVSFAMLLADGVVTCQIDVLTKQVLGVEMLAGAFGLMELKVAALALTLGFLPGWMYDTLGGYTAVFLLLGSIKLVSIVPLLILRYHNLVK